VGVFVLWCVVCGVGVFGFCVGGAVFRRVFLGGGGGGGKGYQGAQPRSHNGKSETPLELI